MNRWLLLWIMAFLIIFTGLASLQAAVVALAFPLVIYLATAFWHRPSNCNISINREISAERVKTGDEVKITIRLTNFGSLLEEAVFEDQIPSGIKITHGSNILMARIPANTTRSWTYSITAKRGYYSLHHVIATIHDPLGLWSTRLDIPTEGQLVVQPQVIHLHRVAIHPRRTKIYSGAIPARQGGPGVEFFGVREYQPGDSPRSMNWRATARHPHELFSNDFEQERAADVGFILDGRQTTNVIGEKSIFEESILATAALADMFLNTGNRVGLFFYGKNITWTIPAYGRLQKERLLHDLAFCETGDSHNFNELFIPSQLFPSRSQLILVSTLLADDSDILFSLRRRSYHILVISPNPVLFETRQMDPTNIVQKAKRIILLQRAVQFKKLRRAGIQVVDWDTSQPFENVAHLALEKRFVQRQGVDI